ncbi:MAG: DMT family transporter [Chitinophagaceae bacterium]|nr:DMT family transporter [Chitinophagaceae bacterium]
MNSSQHKKDIFIGTGLALIAVIVWAGNFIISRGVNQLIGPVSLAFYRWSLATIIITPIAWSTFKKEQQAIRQNFKYLLWVSLTGIALFNTFVYVSGHFTTAINMALIGTTSSPIFATLLALIFLKEKVSAFRLIGMITCIIGILLLLSQGSWQKLMSFHFGKGDLWILTAGMAFAIYSVLVRKKPASISSLNFLMVIFALGTFMLFPFYLIENIYWPKPQFSLPLIGSIIYLGLGTSVISFLCWNIALHKLGTGRTVLFGNLIPIFSTIEAVLILGEKISWLHISSGILVIAGLVIANLRSDILKKKRFNLPTQMPDQHG